MKKTLGIFLSLFFFFLFFSSFVLAGKFGINIGDHYDEFDRAAQTVGAGGWVYVMTCPGEGDRLAEMISSHPEVNIVIRGQYPGDIPSEDLAVSWAATIGSLPKTANKIYFMPWNEPNGPGADDWLSDPATLKSYIQILVKAFDESGVRNRVFLLSPLLNIFQANFDTYANSLGQAFFSQFDGISMNLYGQYENGVLTNDSKRNGQG